MKSKSRRHTPIKERQGPSLMFIIVAVAAVAMVGARFMGYTPAGMLERIEATMSRTASDSGDLIDVTGRGDAVTPTNRTDPLVLIYHAHASENYGPKKETHAKPGAAGDVVEVGKELAAALEAQGIRTIHMSGVYDNPWREAYSASAHAVSQMIAANPSIRLVLDIHRDAVESRQAGIATVQVGSETAAKVLFTVGELNNPYIQENAAIATRLKEQLDALYPGMSRGVRLFNTESNGHVHPNAVEVHIGDYYDNDLNEAKATARYLADVVARVLQ